MIGKGLTIAQITKMANKILSKKVKTEQEQTFLKGILFTLAICENWENLLLFLLKHMSNTGSSMAKCDKLNQYT